MQQAAALPVLDDFNFGRSELGLAGLSKRALLTFYLLHWRTFKRPQYEAFRRARRELWQIKNDYRVGSVDSVAYFKNLLVHLSHVTDATASLLSDELDSQTSVALKLLWRTRAKEPAIKVLMRDQQSRKVREVSQLPNLYPYSANTAFKSIVTKRQSYFASNDLIELFEAGHYENCNRIWQDLYDRTAVAAVPPIKPGKTPISGFLCADSKGGLITSLSVRRTLEMASYHVYTTLRLLQMPPLNARILAASHAQARRGFGWVGMDAMLCAVEPSAQEEFQDVVENVERAISDLRSEEGALEQQKPFSTTENQVEPFPGASDSSRVGSINGSRPEKGAGLMQPIHHDVQEIGRRGYEIYQQLREKLEEEHPGEYVIINVNTGDFVLAPTRKEAWAQYSALFGGNPSWEGRIGDKMYVLGRGRVLQQSA